MICDNYSFSEFIDYVNEIIAHYEGGCEEKYETIKSDLKVLNKKLNDNDLYLGVVGSFSSGKSTFINSVIQKNLLPTNALQGTTVATSVLKKSNHNDLEITYLDGSSKTYSIDYEELIRKYQIDISNLGDIRDKEESLWMRFINMIKRILNIFTNDDKAEIDGARIDLFKKIISTEEMAIDVSSVTLYYENANFPYNIAMVDTPGTESLNKRHNEVTKNAIDNICDAIVVIIPYNEPVSEELVSYINNNMEEYKHDCIFVVTKIELIDDLDELPHLLSVIKKRIENGISISDAVVIPMPTLLYLKTIDEGMKATILDNISEADKNSLIQMYEEGITIINRILSEKRSNYIKRKIISICDRVEERLKANLKDVINNYDMNNERLQKELVPDLSIFEKKANDDIERISNARINRVDGELSFIKIIFSDFHAEIEQKIERCSSSQDLLNSLSFDLTPYFISSQKKASELLNDNKNYFNKQIQKLRSEYMTYYSRCGVYGNIEPIRERTEDVFCQALIEECEYILHASVCNILSTVKKDTNGFFNKVKSFFSNPLTAHKEMALTQLYSIVDIISEKTTLYASKEIKYRISKMKLNSSNAITTMIDADRDLVDTYLVSTNSAINENTRNRNLTQKYIDGLINYRNSMKEVV